VASASLPAKTVMAFWGSLAWRMATLTAGRALAAAQPHTELTTTKVVPLESARYLSTSAAVRVSLMPSSVSSLRMGAIISSSYIIAASYSWAGDNRLPFRSTI
jgi:hypothetical protein